MFPTLTTASCTLINRGTTIGSNHLIQPVLLLGCFVHLEILKNLHAGTTEAFFAIPPGVAFMCWRFRLTRLNP